MPEDEEDGMAKVKGALHLDDLGLLCFDGPDAAPFLQGYLTTDANALGEKPAFTAMCNLKGRTLLTGYAWRDRQRVLLLLHRTLCPVTLAFLRPYLAFSKTKAADLTGDHTLIGAIGLSLGASALSLDAERQVLALERSDAPQAGGNPSDPPSPLENTPAITAAQWRHAAMQRREVWLEAATSGTFLPQMLALDELGAVSFTKGCYLGQEVVARAQHRGKVKRRLTRLEWSGAPPTVGEEIRDGSGRGLGIVVAAAAAKAEAGSTEKASADQVGTALAVIVRGNAPPLSARHGQTRFR